MPRTLRLLVLSCAVSFMACAQTPTPAPSPAAAEPDLKSVLAQMDEASKSFKSAQANVELVQFTALVTETFTQSGEVFFRRHGNNGMDVAMKIVNPHPKRAVVSGDSLTFCDGKTGQLAQRNIGNSRGDVESFMNLGFGGRGQELEKDFDVRLVGWETMDNVKTAKLELVPKSDQLKQFASRITLWIDPKRDVPLKQQRFESSGDYQITHYSAIRLPGQMSDDTFRIKKCEVSK